jgi:DNA-directed RNA polymerase subunit H (RpoH/RPB5)
MASKTVTNSSSLISSVFKSRAVLLELMYTNGYKIDDYSDFSINEVNSMFTNKQLDMLLEQREDDIDLHRKKKIYIRYHLAKTLRTEENLREMIDDLFNIEEILTKQDILYIVIKDEVNETLENLLKHIWEQDGIYIIVQSLKRLQFNILKHSYVPHHRVMSKQEDMLFRKRFNIMNDSQLPEISRFDPVAKAICIRPGEVCEIIRPSKTSISSYYNRICV